MALYVTAGGSFSDSHLYLLDVASMALTPLTIADRLLTGEWQSAAWSPDGTYLYFTRGGSCRGGCWPGSLYRIRPDGTGEQQVSTLRVAQIYGFARG